MMFINYNANTDTFSINSYRITGAIGCYDIGDFAEECQAGHCATMFCGYDFIPSTAAVLCDGEYWQGSDITQDTLETIYNFLMEYVQDNEA